LPRIARNSRIGTKSLSYLSILFHSLPGHYKIYLSVQSVQSVAKLRFSQKKQLSVCLQIRARIYYNLQA